MQRPLIFAAVLVAAVVSFPDCRNSSKPALPTIEPISTQLSTSVPPWACRYGNFDKGADILFGDNQTCVFRFWVGVSDSYQYEVRIPFVTTLAVYREEKESAEAFIRAKYPEEACKVQWDSPQADSVKYALVHEDVTTKGC